MRGGKLRRTVSIESAAISQDGTGAPVQTWATLANCSSVKADIREDSGREQIQAGQVNPQRVVTVIMRYMVGATDAVKAGMRVNYGGRYFYIQAALNVTERNRELELLCLEKAA